MKNKMRYTEHIISGNPTTSIGYMKLLFTYVVISPIRLVNEITEKIMFIGKSNIIKVLKYSIYINLGFLGWFLFWFMFGRGDSFIPFSIILISIIIFMILFALVVNTEEFKYDVIFEKEEDDEINDLEEDITYKKSEKSSENLIVFEEVKAANISFNDSINIFIKDAEELVSMGISPIEYHEAEDSRLLYNIESKSDEFSDNKIIIPDLFEDPPLGIKLEDNFNALMEDLEQQLKTIE